MPSAAVRTGGALEEPMAVVPATAIPARASAATPTAIRRPAPRSPDLNTELDMVCSPLLWDERADVSANTDRVKSLEDKLWVDFSRPPRALARDGMFALTSPRVRRGGRFSTLASLP